MASLPECTGLGTAAVVRAAGPRGCALRLLRLGCLADFQPRRTLQGVAGTSARAEVPGLGRPCRSAPSGRQDLRDAPRMHDPVGRRASRDDAQLVLRAGRQARRRSDCVKPTGQCSGIERHREQRIVEFHRHFPAASSAPADRLHDATRPGAARRPSLAHGPCVTLTGRPCAAAAGPSCIYARCMHAHAPTCAAARMRPHVSPASPACIGVV